MAAEEKALKLLTRVSRIARTRISRGNYINPYKRHQYSDDCLLRAIYRHYEDELLPWQPRR